MDLQACNFKEEKCEPSIFVKKKKIWHTEQ